MKRSVSIPDPLARRADALARELGVTRSELYSAALNDYVARHSPRAVTQALDALADDLSADQAAFCASAGRRTLANSPWSE